MNEKELYIYKALATSLSIAKEEENLTPRKFRFDGNQGRIPSTFIRYFNEYLSDKVYSGRYNTSVGERNFSNYTLKSEFMDISNKIADVRFIEINSKDLLNLTFLLDPIRAFAKVAADLYYNTGFHNELNDIKFQSGFGDIGRTYVALTNLNINKFVPYVKEYFKLEYSDDFIMYCFMLFAVQNRTNDVAFYDTGIFQNSDTAYEFLNEKFGNEAQITTIWKSYNPNDRSSFRFFSGIGPVASLSNKNDSALDGNGVYDVSRLVKYDFRDPRYSNYYGLDYFTLAYSSYQFYVVKLDCDSYTPPTDINEYKLKDIVYNNNTINTMYICKAWTTALVDQLELIGAKNKTIEFLKNLLDLDSPHLESFFYSYIRNIFNGFSVAIPFEGEQMLTIGFFEGLLNSFSINIYDSKKMFFKVGVKEIIDPDKLIAFTTELSSVVNEIFRNEVSNGQ